MRRGAIAGAPSPASGALRGAGLGLRRAFLGDLVERGAAGVDFYEIAPENWIGMGGLNAERLRALTARHPFVCHGLSLSIGGPAPLDLGLVRRIRAFMERHGIQRYSEHLSYCSDAGHLYDLLPIPFTAEAVGHIAGRVRQVQDVLGQRIALENVSYYAALGGELTEIELIEAVLSEADCDLLLDLNNLYVNGINHGYDPLDFLGRLPGERIRYLHVAGHHAEAEDLRIDTHGADVIDPVWDLLGHAYERFGVLPTLLERDFNIPPLDALLAEVDRIRRIQSCQAAPTESVPAHA